MRLNKMRRQQGPARQLRVLACRGRDVYAMRVGDSAERSFGGVVSRVSLDALFRM